MMKNKRVGTKNYQSKSISALTQMLLWLFVFVTALSINIALTSTNNLDSRESTSLNAEVTSLSGSGTETDPYKIGTYDDLVYFANQVNVDTTYEGQYVVLTNDITTDTTTWTPIGNFTDGKYEFEGTFDGQRHSITFSNNVNVVSCGYAGLFGATRNATIKNVSVNWAGGVVFSKNVDYTPNFSAVGGLVGIVQYQSNFPATISSVVVTGDISATGFFYHGGVVGCISAWDYSGNILDSVVFNGTMPSSSSGIIGCVNGANDIEISNLVFVGTGTSKIVNKINLGNNTKDSNDLKFLINNACVVYEGQLSSNLSKKDLINISTSDGDPYAGTIQINNCYMEYIDSSTNAEKRIKIDDSSAWEWETGTLKITDITSQDLKSQSTYTGWDFKDTWAIMSGINGNYPTLQAVYSPIEGTGTQDAPFTIDNYEQLALFANKVNAGTTYEGQYVVLTNDITTDTATWTSIGGNGPTTYNFIFDGTGHTITFTNAITNEVSGGLFGSAGAIKNLGVNWNSVTIVNKNIYGGGIVGAVNTISNCFVTGNVTFSSSAPDFFGGIVGVLSTEMSNCYSRITILGSASNVGGLSGIVAKALIINSYTTSKSNLYSTAQGTPTITNSYYVTKEVVGADYERTPSWMRDQTNLIGWDFENTWTINPDENDGYPMLQVFIKATVITLTAEVAVAREFVVYILNADGSIYNQLVVGNNSNYTFKLSSGTTFTVFVYQTLYANCTINDEKTFKKAFTASGDSMLIALKLSAPERVNNWIMI